MVTFFKTIDVTRLVNVSKRKNLKFNMLLDYCIGRAAASIKEFYLLPVGEQLMQYDSIAVNTIVRNKMGEVSSCDILYLEDLDEFNRQYLKNTTQVAEVTKRNGSDIICPSPFSSTTPRWMVPMRHVSWTYCKRKYSICVKLKLKSGKRLTRP